MTRISKSSSIEKRRIHSSYVHRNKVVERASSVEAITPVNPIFNNVNYSSANHLMYSDTLYDNLMELKYEYLNFYHHERNLHKAIQAIEKDNLIPMENLNNLIDKYNKAIRALTSFDIHLRTNFAESIRNIIKEYEKDLKNIGISIVDEEELKLDEMIFKNMLIQSQEDLNELFEPIRSMIIRLYKGFRNIQGPYREHFDDKYPDLIPRNTSGMVLDEKS